MSRECSTSVDNRKAYIILVGKPDKKRLLARPRRKWKDIRLDLMEID
jgi:hypothetical protein